MSDYISVVGLGYVGLPLAVGFARVGCKVLGVDIQPRRVELVNQGRSYIEDVSDEELKKVVSSGNLISTTDQSRLSEPDAILICVPTPLTRTKAPDLSYVTSEASTIAKYLRPGQLVVLESTTYPGTTEEVLKPILERSGLKAGKEFFLAFSPERVDPGNKHYRLENTPKLVGGVDPESTRRAVELYKKAVRVVVPVSSPRVAELTKVFENVFRSVNIALVNELSQLCHRLGISVWEVLDAAATKPYGYMRFSPGPGVGGHCIPLDPYYLANKAKEYDFHTRFIELAGEINESMPYWVVSRITEALNERGQTLKGAKLLVLGLAYKPDIGDLRESPSLKLSELLIKRGAIFSYNDPHIPEAMVAGTLKRSSELTPELLTSQDCTIIATNHSSYDYPWICRHAKLLFDCRGVTRDIPGPNILRL